MVVSLDKKGDVALVILDDGGENVINHEVWPELERVIDQGEADSKAFVLVGRPGVLCTGFDIKVMTDYDPGAAKELSRRGGQMALRFYSFEKPLVGACTGHCFTVGYIWLLTCDTRIREYRAFKYGMTETALGVNCGLWSIAPVKGRLHPKHFMRAMVKLKVCDPEGALEAGFVDVLADQGQAMGRGVEVAAELAEMPAAASACNKMCARNDINDIV